MRSEKHIYLSLLRSMGYHGEARGFSISVLYVVMVCSSFVVSTGEVETFAVCGYLRPEFRIFVTIQKRVICRRKVFIVASISAFQTNASFFSIAFTESFHVNLYLTLSALSSARSTLQIPLLTIEIY